MKKILIILITSVFCSIITLGQRGGVNEEFNPNEAEKNAYAYLQEGKFENALALYKKLLIKDEQNPRLHFLLGYSYLNTEFGLVKAIDHLKQSIELTPDNISDKAPLEAYYYLALAYHQNNQYKLALLSLDELIQLIPANNKFFINKVNNLKKYCLNAEVLKQGDAKIEEQNIFELNSKYSDKYPLIINNGEEIIFTSRRENPLRRNTKGKQFDDNIYYAKKEDGSWTTPYSLSNTINTENNESACWVSKDGNYLIIRRVERNKSSLLYSTRSGGSDWSAPQKFPSPINSKGNETFGSLSSNGKYLFFTSDRRGGFGGTDIYMSENLGANKWGEPVNLGTKINTPFNEDSPFMHENGVLFFCSEGHFSMGGFDIFTSYRDNNGNWQAAANMGTPINSIEDDFFYQPLPDGQLAYSSSERKGSKGQSDIFKYKINDSIGVGYALVSGKIKSTRKIEWSNDVEIIVREIGGGYKIKKFKTNEYGDFSFTILAAKNYQITYTYERQVFYDATLKIPKSYSYLANDQSIRLRDVELILFDNSEVVQPVKVGNNEVYVSENKTTKEMEIAKNNLALKKAAQDSILVSEKIENETNIETNEVIQYFSIKLLTSKEKKPLSSFEGIENVKEFFDSKGYYVYYFGEYDYEWEAEIKLRLIRDTYPKATIFKSTMKPN